MATTKKFTVPPSARGPNDPARVMVRELTFEESLAATKAARGERARMAHEATMIAWAGQVTQEAEAHAAGTGAEPVWQMFDLAARESDFAYKALSPKVRALLVQAYSLLNNSTDEEDADFLKSAIS